MTIRRQHRKVGNSAVFDAKYTPPQYVLKPFILKEMKAFLIKTGGVSLIFLCDTRIGGRAYAAADEFQQIGRGVQIQLVSVGRTRQTRQTGIDDMV